METRRLSLIAMLSSLSFVGRMMFTFLPNVQPTTVIILIVSMYLGTYDGWLVAIISILISNLYLGMGVWTLAQIVSFSVLILIVHICKKINLSIGYYPIVALLMGFTYGFIISLVQAPFFGWVSFLPYWISGLPYDLNHAVGNYLFFIILHPPLSRILKNQKKKILIR